jgi:predicted transcriptional regulator
MEFTLEFFSNDRYDILKLLCDNQIKVKDDFYVPLSQQEIADIAHFSKLKTNKLLNELMDNGFITYFNGKRGKYAITDKGHKALQLIQKNNC